MKKRNGIMTFRLPDEEKAKLVGYAEQADCSLSDLAVRAVRNLIEQMEASTTTKKATKTAKKK